MLFRHMETFPVFYWWREVSDVLHALLISGTSGYPSMTNDVPYDNWLASAHEWIQSLDEW